MAYVLLDQQEGVATVTLNRPEAMNALSRALRDELCQCLAELAANRSVRAVVLTGAGERAFTAGLDLKELGSDTGQLSAANATAKSDNPVKAIEACPQPVIGAINGVAITGGFELALACDFLIASPNARFADTHGRVGIMPGWGLSARLSRLIGLGRAKQLSMTGNFLDADTALAWGLVNEVVPASHLLARAQALARDIASIDPTMAQDYKKLMDEGYGLSFAEALALEHHVSAARNGAVRPEEVEQRRRAVMERGREQQA